MKNFTILLINLFFLNTIIGQDCKPLGTTKDKETGERTAFYGGPMSGKLELKGISFTPSIYLLNDPNEKINYIQTLVNFSHIPANNYRKNDEKWFDVGTTFELILKNGERILFRSTMADFKNQYKQVYQGYQLAPLSDENLKKITESEIATFKIYPFLSTDVLPLSYDLRGTKGEKLLKQFNCFNSKGYENTGKVQNSRKSETFLKLADKYVNSGKYEKALEYYKKSDDEFPNPFSKAKISILNIFTGNKTEDNLNQIGTHLDGVKRQSDAVENIKFLETLVLNLIEIKPDNEELEQVLLLVAE